ncbi:ITGA5 isoform 12 [Pan troglodytes]|uniref:Integrin subunit alpha 5 n=2 Tax=Homininae TaxID=207598 RepID=B4E3F4_HUMAN|nr:integrin subunit alpha 5 [Homo sapiens]KAI4066363.1 integrin subunit alpha 5 [Homo sapiens]PNI89932.1 ITGA5 isoform 12 [Pan troglodytes]BAG65466.1 unnamed protein product [Homo sapiens]
MGSRTPESPLHAVQLRWGPRRRPPLLPLLLLLLPPPPRVGGFNLDAEAPAVLSGPPGSFFGFSVEFYRPGTDGLSAPGVLTVQLRGRGACGVQVLAVVRGNSSSPWLLHLGMRSTVQLAHREGATERPRGHLLPLHR